MSYLNLPILLVVLLFGVGPLFGQELSVEDQEKVKTLYFGNEALFRANQFYHDGQTEEARVLLEKEIKELRKGKEWPILGKAVSLLADTYNTKESYSTGLKFIDETLEHLSSNVTNAISTSSKLRLKKARLLATAGEVDQSIDVLKANIVFWKESGKDLLQWDYVMSLYDLCSTLNNNGRFKEELPYVQEVFEKMEALNFERVDDVLSVFEFHDRCLFELGKSKERIAFSIKALEIAERIMDSDDFRLIRRYDRMGFMYITMGEYREGLYYFDKAIYQNEKVNLPLKKQKEIGVYSSYYYKAVIHGAFKEYEKALATYANTLKVIDETDIKRIAWKVKVNAQMASLYLKMKDNEAALDHIDRANNILQDIYKQNPNKQTYYHFFRNLNYNYSVIYGALGQHDLSLQHTLKIIQHYSNPNAPRENTAIYIDAANGYYKKGMLDSCVYYSHLAFQSFAKDSISADYFELPSVDVLPEDGSIYLTLSSKIAFMREWILSFEDPVEREAAYNKLLDIADFVDAFHIRNLKNINDFRQGQNQQLIKSSVGAYKKILRVAYEKSLQDSDQKWKEKIFYFAQKKKAQGFWLNTMSNEAIDGGYIPDSLLLQERQMRSDISKVENDIYLARLEKNEEKAKELELIVLTQKKKELAQLIKKNEEAFPRYFESKYAFSVESSEDISQLLEEDEILIEYAQVDSVFYIFLLERDQALEVAQVVWPFKDQRSINTLLDKLQANSWTRKKHRQQLVDVSHQLYQYLIAPIAKRIEGKKRLSIIGEGMTHYIPFEMLLRSDEVKSYQDLNYLIKDFEITYHYSANLFAKARRNQRSIYEQDLLAFAPIYEDISTARLDTNDYFNPALRAFQLNGSFSPLPESEREIKAINALQQNSSEYLIRREANKENLLQIIHKPYRFIHIAGHSFADLDNPKFSGIACWQGGEIKEDILFTSEIYNLKIQTDLVVLSSCESGLGSYDVSEGILGLNRAFLYAGANNVIFSLWKVYDKVSADLMINFYEKVMEGKPYSTALREAKLALINNPQTAAPHLWSSFLLIGR